MSDKKIATLSSTRKADSGETSPDHSKRQQSFFVGGSGQSGQEVLGPDSSQLESLNNNEAIMRFMSIAQAHGVEASTFTDEQDHRNEGITNSQLNTEEGSGRNREVIIDLWQNGFSVDRGPLRDYIDPNNNAFLQSVALGRIPPELKRQNPERDIVFRMMRHNTTYTYKPQPFSGKGKRLGDLVPPVVGARNIDDDVHTGTSIPFASMVPSRNSYKTDGDSLKLAQEAVGIKEDEPLTKLQIRFPDGHKIVGVFNVNHTVQNVRTFIVSAVPSCAFEPFSLMTTFPSRLIDSESATLKEAGLINMVILVKPTSA